MYLISTFQRRRAPLAASISFLAGIKNNLNHTSHCRLSLKKANSTIIRLSSLTMSENTNQDDSYDAPFRRLSPEPVHRRPIYPSTAGPSKQSSKVPKSQKDTSSPRSFLDFGIDLAERSLATRLTPQAGSRPATTPHSTGRKTTSTQHPPGNIHPSVSGIRPPPSRSTDSKRPTQENNATWMQRQAENFARHTEMAAPSTERAVGVDLPPRPARTSSTKRPSQHFRNRNPRRPTTQPVPSGSSNNRGASVPQTSSDTAGRSGGTQRQITWYDETASERTALLAPQNRTVASHLHSATAQSKVQVQLRSYPKTRDVTEAARAALGLSRARRVPTLIFAPPNDYDTQRFLAGSAKVATMHLTMTGSIPLHAFSSLPMPVIVSDHDHVEQVLQERFAVGLVICIGVPHGNLTSLRQLARSRTVRETGSPPIIFVDQDTMGSNERIKELLV